MGAIALHRHQEDPAATPEPDGLTPGPAIRPRPLRFYLGIAAILAALGGLATLAELPEWRESPTLATVNLVMSLTFILTGLLLRQERGQRGVAWALILAGVFRSLDFIDAWNTGPWPVYAVVFGGIDRVFGGYALLRYPRAALGRIQWAYLLGLAGWMVLSRGLVVVTSTAPSTGYPASAWWPTISANPQLSGIFSTAQNIGDAIFAVLAVILLVRRLLETRGLDRIVIAPIIAAAWPRCSP